MDRRRKLVRLFVLGLLAVNLASAQNAATPKPAVQPEVAPGVPLPDKGWVWILDQQDGRAQLIRLYHNKAKVSSHTGENVVKGLFAIPQSQTVDLDGASAKTRIQTHRPVIVMRRDMEEEEDAATPQTQDRAILLLRVHAGEKDRTAASFICSVVSPRPKRHEKTAAITTEAIPGTDWIRVTPNEDLPDGEYALVWMPTDRKLFNDAMYDFGVGQPAPPQTRK